MRKFLSVFLILVSIVFIVSCSEEPYEVHRHNYVFDSYIENADGTVSKIMVCSCGDIISEIVTDVLIVTPENVQEKLNELQSGQTLYFTAGTYTETNSIQVKSGQSIFIKGDGKESTEVKANITMSADSSLKLEDIKLSADSGNLVNGNSGGINIELDNVELVPAGNARGINIEVTDVESRVNGVSILMNNSAINLSSSNGSAGYSRAINVNGDSTSSGSGRLVSFSLNMDNSSIGNATDGSIYGISVFRILDLDLNISGSSIDIPKNHYPIYIYGCGNEERVSNVNISGTELKGYSAYYVNGDSKNINAVLTNCTFTCINKNTGGYSDFSVLVVQNSTDCNTSTDNCSFVFGPETSGDCAMYLVGTQYSDESFDTASTGGCVFNLTNCTFNYTLVTVENDPIIAMLEVPQSDEFREDVITFDSATQNSLLSLLPGGNKIEILKEETPYTYYGSTIKGITYQLTNS